MKRKPIKSMTSEELVEEFASIQRWSGDDFAIHQIPDREVARGQVIKAEMLRRMTG